MLIIVHIIFYMHFNYQSTHNLEVSIDYCHEVKDIHKLELAADHTMWLVCHYTKLIEWKLDKNYSISLSGLEIVPLHVTAGPSTIFYGLKTLNVTDDHSSNRILFE